jgi:L-asparaginase/Glu-tRNA(Gln) amidotransferase subunit D
MRKDSLELTDADRALIAARVAAAPGARILITHGTDTMTDTARALAHIPGKTIVLVGALAPARFSESDAAFNLGMAFACCQVAPPGIYITMHGQVSPGAACGEGSCARLLRADHLERATQKCEPVLRKKTMRQTKNIERAAHPHVSCAPPLRCDTAANRACSFH